MLLILTFFWAKGLDCKLNALASNYQRAVKHLGTIRTDTYSCRLQLCLPVACFPLLLLCFLNSEYLLVASGFRSLVDFASSCRWRLLSILSFFWQGEYKVDCNSRYSIFSPYGAESKASRTLASYRPNTYRSCRDDSTWLDLMDGMPPQSVSISRIGTENCGTLFISYLWARKNN